MTPLWSVTQLTVPGPLTPPWWLPKSPELLPFFTSMANRLCPKAHCHTWKPPTTHTLPPALSTGQCKARQSFLNLEGRLKFMGSLPVPNSQSVSWARDVSLQQRRVFCPLTCPLSSTPLATRVNSGSPFILTLSLP